MIKFTRTKHHPQVSLEDAVGSLPYYWDAKDSRPALVQHNSKPSPGGPFASMKGFTYDPTNEALQYPDDPALLPLAYAVLPLTNERIVVYPHAWVAIVQDDGTIRVDRRD